ncbi:hypothetical protein FOL47_001123 [Perkinsus chesapeaki]|uniref:Peptidase C1A papain C-terminal domain-containing protein n=1 Tax=Perkinsus chesapeaki TaxID=330153 RepID=A0A7J6MJW6_PERCH|nr:hypothetical protein FOL47_001123 [Perkinsus chesapeaki]
MNRPGFAFVTGIILAQCAVMGKELPDVEVLEKFALFTKKYSTPYEDAMEGTFRVGAFADNLKFMDQKIKKGHMKGYLPPPTDLVQDTPVELNWAERGAVNSPMDQGDCNSCYAIVTLGVLEAAFWKATGSLARFSIQQVIDCSEMEGNEGCLHGNRGDTLQYIVNYGIVSDGDYPYRQMESDCNAVVDDRSKQCLQAHDLDEDDVTVIQENKLSQLFQALQEGPLAVQVDVTPKQWKSYKGGILECERPLVLLSSAMEKLTTVSYSLDMELKMGKVTGSSGIAGELVGEKADMPGFTEIRLLKKDQERPIPMHRIIYRADLLKKLPPYSAVHYARDDHHKLANAISTNLQEAVGQLPDNRMRIDRMRCINEDGAPGKDFSMCSAHGVNHALPAVRVYRVDWDKHRISDWVEVPRNVLMTPSDGLAKLLSRFEGLADSREHMPHLALGRCNAFTHDSSKTLRKIRPVEQACNLVRARCPVGGVAWSRYATAAARCKEPDTPAPLKIQSVSYRLCGAFESIKLIRAVANE